MQQQKWLWNAERLRGIQISLKIWLMEALSLSSNCTYKSARFSFMNSMNSWSGFCKACETLVLQVLPARSLYHAGPLQRGPRRASSWTRAVLSHKRVRKWLRFKRRWRSRKWGATGGRVRAMRGGRTIGFQRREWLALDWRS